MRSLAAFLGLAVALAAAPASAGSQPRVQYKDDRLTLHAEDTPVMAILEELKRQSGADVRGETPERNVTADLDAVPLHEALQRLLGDGSFTLTYADDGRLRAVELKGGPQGARPPSAEAPRAQGPKSEGKKWDTIADVFNSQGAIPVDGRMKDVAGKDQMTWDTLFRAIYESKDRTVREDGIRAGIRAVEADPMMRDTLVAALGNYDDAELTQFARLAAGQTADSPETIAKQIFRESHTPEIRLRVRGVLRQLRADRVNTRAAR